MSVHLGDHATLVEAAQSALDAAADIAVFRFGACPVRILRWGAVVSVELDNTTGLIAKLDKTTHAADGTPTRSDGSGGADLHGAGTDPVGTVLYVNPVTEIIVNSGDFVTVQVTQAATAGDGWAFVEYQELPVGSEKETTVLSEHAVDSSYAT